MANVPALFGSLVFNDTVMKNRLPKDIYKALQKTIKERTHLELDVANVVAAAMKDWATELGATHFTHWFQPMTGITAEKHDSFISPQDDGTVIMEFSGKELVRGEPDASSFPSGGIRATFEARGYTAWDPTSYAFIKDGTLCIPTAFCSYTGEALDKKTPLLRSMDAISKQALRILKLFGNTTAKTVLTTVGPEQEYFIIDKSVYLKRPDLIYTGRTLFGARPPKGQELEDQYFAALKPRISAFMQEVDAELWKLGILAKTKHNEVAPAQHELAPIFSTTNIATDHNQLTMEIMKKVADKHGLVCLLHEKPFAGINGSGKHNNWSISTDTGLNLLEPGDTPFENAQFLLFLVAVIKAVNKYQDALRISIASAGNDHRLGANEAPPAILSIFLGEELTDIITAIAEDKSYVGHAKVQMEIGATVLPHFPKDNTDRNRTSPFAFTGNKFEFRAVGSSQSIAEPNIVLNTAVADILCDFADELEKSEDFITDAAKLIKKTILENDRIIFNGNGYDDAWVVEAEKRGLSNLKTTPDALAAYLTEQNINLFSKHGVYSKKEIESRHEIYLENYVKTLTIEALTAIDLVNQKILPAAMKYTSELAKKVQYLKEIAPASVELTNTAAYKMWVKVGSLADELSAKTDLLSSAIAEVRTIEDMVDAAYAYRSQVFTAMNEVRIAADELELVTDSQYWPLPTYGELLFSVI